MWIWEADGAVFSQAFAALPPDIAIGLLQAPLKLGDIVVATARPTTEGLRKLAVESQVGAAPIARGKSVVPWLRVSASQPLCIG